MFMEVEFEWTIVVQPHEMKTDNHIKRALLRRLLKDFSAIKCTEEHGYYVTPTTVNSIGEGRLWERRGCAAYPVRFLGVVFKPLKNERLLVVVSEISDTGIFCSCGPVDKLFISKKHLEGYEHMTAESEDRLYRHKADSTLEIEKGSVVRAEVLGLKWLSPQQGFHVVGVFRGFDRRYKKLQEPKPDDRSNEQMESAGEDGWGTTAIAAELGGEGWGTTAIAAELGDEGWGDTVAVHP